MNMKKLAALFLALMLSLILLVGCSNPTDGNDGKKVTFGMTTWTSTMAPTAIAKMLLEEAGYEVETVLLDQPIIFQGIANQQIDFFMDAWLPYTEAALWEQHGDDLKKVAISYADAPLGLVVPASLDMDSIEDLVGNSGQFRYIISTIDPGAGIVALTEEVIEAYGLQEYELMTSSEAAMLADATAKINRGEPVVFTGWRPHSMFAMHDLKFLEDPKEIYKLDNVYVLSYKGIEERHPEAYSIMSQWSIDVGDLEVMMLKYNEEDIDFEVTAAEWIENNRDQVNRMLGK